MSRIRFVVGSKDLCTIESATIASALTHGCRLVRLNETDYMIDRVLRPGGAGEWLVWCTPTVERIS